MLNKNYFTYLSINSLVHSMNSTAKVIILVLSLMSLILLQEINLIIFSIIIFMYMILTRVPIMYYFKIIYIFRYIFVLFILICALFYVPLTVCFITIVKIILLLESVMIITYTTSPIEIANGIDNTINPFNILFIKTGKLTLFIMLKFKSIPVFLSVTEKIFSSQASRGFDFIYRTIIGKIFVFIVSVPAIIRKSMLEIKQIKTNMKLKIFDGNKIRTKYHENKVSLIDVLLIFIICINIIFYIFGVVWNILFP